MYQDLLARIKNAQAAGRESLLAPYSKMDFAIAQILSVSKYIGDVQKKLIERKNYIEVKLIYSDRRPAMTDFKIVSKPSRHLYTAYRDLKSVKSGHGLGVISTPKGIMTNKEARRAKVGGEYLFEVW